MFRSSHFHIWFLVIFVDEVTKILHNLFYILQGKMSKTEKNLLNEKNDSNQAHDNENNTERPCLLSPRSNNLQEKNKQNLKFEKVKDKAR